uniref:mRNA 5'-phosphatase n=1 Tax=Trypanosoma congolense (strain IL3000) TaxID=1068625 RepID=G0UQ75_TRYCI|nr:conserved hypothetical protein [Trypanosoma congolense IL3000]
MLHRLQPYRDPLVQVIADALAKALEAHRKSATSETSIEFECRLGTYSAARHSFTHPFSTHTNTPAVLQEGPTALPFFFFSGVSQPTFYALHDELKKASTGRGVPPRSTVTLSVHTVGALRAEYAMNDQCNEGVLQSVTEKERIFAHNVRCPTWAADFRLSVSREKRVCIDNWTSDKWEHVIPKISRLRQRKSVSVSPLFTIDLSVVRSFTDHSRFVNPLGPRLQVPLVSAPYLSYDVELEVKIDALKREVHRTRLLDSTAWRTAENVLTLLQFMTVKRENSRQK